MSATALLYLLGMALVFIGERLLGGHETWHWVSNVAGLAVLGSAALVEVARLRKSRDAGIRLGRRLVLATMFAGFAALVLYVGTTDFVVDGLDMSREGEVRWVAAWGSLWPIVWLAGTLPLLLLDHLLWRSPVIVPSQQVRHALAGGLAAALGIALVFPVNYIATQHNKRWDLTYFKTTEPGTATRNIVAALGEPVTVRVFAAPASEIADELRGYFEPLQGPNLRLEVLDQAGHPRLAKALRVPDNGVVAITRGEVDLSKVDEDEDDAKAESESADEEDGEDEDARPMTRTIEIGTDIDRAKRKLKTLDAEVQTTLLEIGHGERVAYVTTGHGELGWESNLPHDRRLMALREVLRALHFKVDTLSLRSGFGDAVPEDANLVLLLGPMQALHESEVQALKDYVERGGALLVALDPDRRQDVPGIDVAEDPLDSLLTFLGVRLERGTLAAEGGYVPLWHNMRDRGNLVTNRFSVHPTTKVLAQNAARLLLFLPGAGWLTEVPDTQQRVVFVVRSLEMAWADLNGNFQLDKNEEKRERAVAAAVSGGTGSTEFRAMVLADANVYSDLALRNLANQQFLVDSVNWLVGSEAMSGTTETEKDVKIQHTKEDQAAWFYGTILGVPVLVLLLGFVRVRMRRKGGR